MTFLIPLIQNSTIPPTRVGLVEMDGLLRGSPLEPIKLVSGSLQGARGKNKTYLKKVQF